jgi:hypothetical protein|tara:strand:- start:24 stop:401 length:378 start_codon:yes stop_codon:yes gene_type:complete
MLSGIIKSVGLGATIQTAELDNDSVTAPKIAGAPANTYTQTYSTADRTVANATTAALTLSNMTDGSANNTLENIGSTSGGDVSGAIEKNFDKVGDEVNSLITDVDDIRQTVSALIDDLQTIGLVG